jgi:uncharacterized membrane protein YfcA
MMHNKIERFDQFQENQMEYIVYLCLGSMAGLASGLLGIGGGNVIVPVLVISFAAYGISAEIYTHIAIATSLASIALTSLSSIYTHYQRRVLDWYLLKVFVPSVVAGSLVGTLFFISTDGEVLQVLLGFFLVFTGLKMVSKTIPKPNDVSINRPILSIFGVVIGALSAVFGVGGGMFTTPLLTNFGLSIHKAIGISAVSGFFIAICTSIIYGSANISNPNLLTNNFGYIYLPALIGIVITSVPFARVGALLAHRTNASYLKKIFGLFLFFVGARFVLINLDMLTFVG